MVGMKPCPDCKQVLPETEFGRDKYRSDGLSYRCKACGKVYEAKRRAANPGASRLKVARWAAKNPEKIRAYTEAHKAEIGARGRAWAKANPDAVAEKTKRWRAANKQRVADTQRQYRETNVDKIKSIKRRWIDANPEKVKAHAARRRADPKYRIEATIRSRLHATLTKGEKSAATFTLLGYAVEQLRTHLERQFIGGMSWENYGEWHVDHIVPLAAFTYRSPADDEFRAAWALSNLRPLWAEKNIAKGAKRLTLL